MGFYQFKREQKVPGSIDDIWKFISSPANLKLITPEHMGFDIITEDLPQKMYPGMIVAYKVSPLPGYKTTWVTEITHVRDKEFFVDEQRVGPYSMWHHEHHIEAIKGGVLMKDIVSYKPPYGFLGNITNKLLIRRQLEKIFAYRKTAMERIFGKID